MTIPPPYLPGGPLLSSQDAALIGSRQAGAILDWRGGRRGLIGRLIWVHQERQHQASLSALCKHHQRGIIKETTSQKWLGGVLFTCEAVYTHTLDPATGAAGGEEEGFQTPSEIPAFVLMLASRNGAPETWVRSPIAQGVKRSFVRMEESLLRDWVHTGKPSD